MGIWRQPVFKQREVRTETAMLLEVLENSAAPRWKQRQNVILSLAKKPLPPGEKQAFSERLACILDRRLHEPFSRRTLRPFLQSLVIVLPVAICMATMLAMEDNRPSGMLSLVQWVGFILIMSLVQEIISFPFLLPYALAKDVKLDNRVRAVAALALGSVGDCDSLASLADALSDFNSDVRKEASRALPMLLSTLLKSPELSLSPLTTTHLCRSLFHQDTETIPLSLQAIEKGGTSQAIPYLEHLFKAFGRPDAIEVTSPQKTVAEILLVLHERKRLEEQRERLVRSSEAPPNAGLLLRPASTMEIEDTSVLLRPVTTDNNGG